MPSLLVRRAGAARGCRAAWRGRAVGRMADGVRSADLRREVVSLRVFYGDRKKHSHSLTTQSTEFISHTSQPVESQGHDDGTVIRAFQLVEVLHVDQRVGRHQPARDEGVIDAQPAVAAAVARPLRPIGELSV